MTRAHHDALQVRLTNQHPDRGLPEYTGSSLDITAVKIAYLQTIASAEDSPQRHSDPEEDQEIDNDNSEADDEYYSDINRLFPYIFTYLDTSILDFKLKPRRFMLPALIRQEYNIISELINKKSQSIAGSVIVSGQPGIGEVLVSLLHKI